MLSLVVCVYRNPNFAIGWGHAFSAPFKYLKGFASHRGGTANPLIVKWPSVIGPALQGGLRHQFSHVNDICK